MADPRILVVIPVGIDAAPVDLEGETRSNELSPDELRPEQADAGYGTTE